VNLIAVVVYVIKEVQRKRGEVKSKNIHNIVAGIKIGFSDGVIIDCIERVSKVLRSDIEVVRKG